MSAPSRARPGTCGYARPRPRCPARGSGLVGTPTTGRCTDAPEGGARWAGTSHLCRRHSSGLGWRVSGSSDLGTAPHPPDTSGVSAVTRGGGTTNDVAGSPASDQRWHRGALRRRRGGSFRCGAGLCPVPLFTGSTGSPNPPAGTTGNRPQARSSADGGNDGAC